MSLALTCPLFCISNTEMPSVLCVLLALIDVPAVYCLLFSLIRSASAASPDIYIYREDFDDLPPPPPPPPRDEEGRELEGGAETDTTREDDHEEEEEEESKAYLNPSGNPAADVSSSSIGFPSNISSISTGMDIEDDSKRKSKVSLGVFILCVFDSALGLVTDDPLGENDHPEAYLTHHGYLACGPWLMIQKQQDEQLLSTLTTLLTTHTAQTQLIQQFKVPYAKRTNNY